MSGAHEPYASDVPEDEQALIALCLTPLPEGPGQRGHCRREVFDGLPHAVEKGAPWRRMLDDPLPWTAVH